MSESAVKKQTSRKRTYEETGGDFYPTPPWATRVLLEDIDIYNQIVWEPAAGDGSMSKVFFNSYPSKIISSDLNPRAKHIHKVDFLSSLEVDEFRGKATYRNGPDWVITNPPYTMLLEFFKAAWSLPGSMAFFCRLQALEGGERGEFFEKHPPSKIIVFSERVQGIAPQGFFDLTKSSMQAYCWLVWDKYTMSRDTNKPVTVTEWVPKGTAKRLTKDWDYDVGFEQVLKEHAEQCGTCGNKHIKEENYRF